MLPPNLVNIALSKKHALVRSHRFLELHNLLSNIDIKKLAFVDYNNLMCTECNWYTGR